MTGQDSRAEGSANNEPLKSAYERARERLDNEAPEEAPGAERIEVERVMEEPDDAGGDDAFAAAQAQVEEYKDRYLRSLAELDNFRKRSQRERADWTAEAVRSMAADLIDVLDNLEMALAEAAEDNPLSVGVKAVCEQFRGLLKRRGIERIQTVEGDVFDPDLHQALMMDESDAVEGTVVGAVLRPGYMIKDKVLRPAQVKATRGTSASSA